MKERTLPILLIVLITLVFSFACTKKSSFGPPKDNVFRHAIRAKIATLDPHAATDVYSDTVITQVYEPLYEYHYLKRPLQVIPVLADGMPKWSRDKKTITVKMKKGVKFQDDPCFEATGGKGREVTADDFIYGIHRMAAPKFTSPMYGSLAGIVEGIEEYHKGKAKTISGVKKVDSHTFSIRITKVQPRFIYNLTSKNLAIVPKEAVEKYGDQFSRHPVGTGPYKLEQADLNHKIVFTKSKSYRPRFYPKTGQPGDREKGLLKDAGNVIPFVEKIIFEIIPEDQPRWLKFLAGQLEYAKIPKDSIGTAAPNGRIAADLEKKGIQLFREPSADVTVIIFNMDDPVWGKKKELRQAVAYALDMPEIIKLQYASQAIRAHSVVDPLMYGYDPNYKSPYAKRDLKKAKELLAKAGYPEGKGLPPVIFPTTSSTTARQLDELLKRQLAEVGIVFKPEPGTWPELVRRTRKKRDFVAVGIGYASSTPDFDDTAALVHSKYIGVHNAANYKNPKMDRLIEQIEASENSPSRLRKIKMVKDIMNEDLPYLTMVHRIGNQLIHSWVKNHVFTDSLTLGPWLKYHRVLSGKSPVMTAKE